MFSAFINLCSNRGTRTYIGILFLISIFEVRSDNAIRYTPAVERTVQVSFKCGQEMGFRVMGIKLPNEFGKLAEDNAALNELWGCVWTKLELIDKESKPNEEKIIDYFVDAIKLTKHGNDPNRDAIKFIVRECIDVKGSDHGNTAIKIQNCVNSQFTAYSTLLKLLSGSQLGSTKK